MAGAVEHLPRATCCCMHQQGLSRPFTSASRPTWTLTTRKFLRITLPWWSGALQIYRAEPKLPCLASVPQFSKVSSNATWQWIHQAHALATDQKPNSFVMQTWSLLWLRFFFIQHPEQGTQPFFIPMPFVARMPRSLNPWGRLFRSTLKQPNSSAWILVSFVTNLLLSCGFMWLQLSLARCVFVTGWRRAFVGYQDCLVDWPTQW